VLREQPEKLKKDRKSVHLLPAQIGPSIANRRIAIATLTSFVDSHTSDLITSTPPVRIALAGFIRFLFEIAYSVAISLFFAVGRTGRALCLQQECKLCLRLQAKPALRLLATCPSYFVHIP
jgi:hypothetical protein